MIKLGNWHDEIGTSHENSAHREAPNKHLRGTKKYQEMIDRDSKNSDRFKNLPFKISKPPKRSQPRRDIFNICNYCRDISVVNKNTVGRVCCKCTKYTSVSSDNSYKTEEELLTALEQLDLESLHE